MRQEITNVDQVIIEDALCIIEQEEDARVADRIEDVLRLLAAFNDVALAQDSQLLRERALLDSQSSTQVVHANFALPQCVQNLDPERMRERLEEFRSEG